MTHWWAPGAAPCGAGILDDFTAEPDRVTCPACRSYVEMRCKAAGATPEEVGAQVRAALEGQIKI